MAETSTKLGRVSLVPRGAYDPAETYNRLDIIAYGGSSYMVLTDGIAGVTPENAPPYMLIAEKGSKGDTGERGKTGKTGAAGSDGIGIQQVERTSGDGSPGTTDTYTITLTNGQMAVFDVYNGRDGEKGEPGTDGTSFTVLGRYDTMSDLEAAHPTGREGEAWAVGSAQDNAIYLWNVDTQAWDNIGSLQGPPGPAGVDGASGADGKSAYQYAVDGGYAGTEDDFQSVLAKMMTSFGDWWKGLTEEGQRDPEIVYRSTRPADWMALPNDGEVLGEGIWLLFQWPQETNDSCTFQVSAADGFSVEAGRYANGEFTPNEAYTTDHARSGNVTLNLNGADFGDDTSTGDVQALVRIRGRLTRFTMNSNMANCVDGVVRAPNLTTLNFGSGSKLRYINLLAMGSQNVSVSFRGNYYLQAVRGQADGLNAVTDGGSMFSDCHALCALPDGTTFGALNMGVNMFYNCYALRALPDSVTFASLNVGVYMFSNCCALRKLPEGVIFVFLNTGESMFDGCRSLTKLPDGVSFEALNYAYNMFSNCGFGREGLVQIFKSLPTVASATEIAVQGCPGVAGLTEADKAIATGKGWTLKL